MTTTDFHTALQDARAQQLANRPPAPDPVRIDLTQTRRNTKVGTVFHAYMEDSDMWDGWALYDNLQDALQGAAVDYVESEHGSDQDDPEERYDGVLEWHFVHGSWHLSDGDRDTGVYVTETAVYAARTGQEAGPAADGQAAACPCRERGQDGDGWVRYQGRDGEFVTLQCRDHEAAAQ